MKSFYLIIALVLLYSTEIAAQTKQNVRSHPLIVLDRLDVGGSERGGEGRPWMFKAEEMGDSVFIEVRCTKGTDEQRPFRTMSMNMLSITLDNVTTRKTVFKQTLSFFPGKKAVVIVPVYMEEDGGKFRLRYSKLSTEEHWLLWEGTMIEVRTARQVPSELPVN